MQPFDIIYKKALTVLKKHKKLPVEDIHRSLDIVQYILDEAADFNLQAEVVTWSLKFMKENPHADISDAIEAGYNEWIK